MTFYISPFYLSLLIGLLSWPFVSVLLSMLFDPKHEESLFWGTGLASILLTLLFLNHYWI